MICPACQKNLKEIKIGSLAIDVCAGGCGGAWFDNFEIKQVDEPHEHAGEALLDISRDDSIKIDYAAKRKCPRCQDILMMKHFFSIQKKVEIDECAQCGGIWLDVGELAGIRALYSSEAERNKAAEEYFSQVVKTSLADIQAQSDADLARAKKVAHLFRFICPSFYIPGDQEWGAF